MESFQQYIAEYRSQLNKGMIQKAYKGLMEYIMELRTHFQHDYPEYFVSGNLYTGYMDMTYFSINPLSLKARKLRIAIVFIHQALRFEAWLAGYNKQVQAQYWKTVRESGWNKYPVVSTIKGADSIIEFVLVDQPDFGDLPALTVQIESAASKFIKDVESFLATQP